MKLNLFKENGIHPQQIPEDREDLIRWFRKEARPLPWRASKDPYRIWISEVMLQQTTVTAVIPYFERFLKKFPRIQDLAEASLEEVYSVWSGLGYYSRARNLHQASRIFSVTGFPRHTEDLLKIPGLGPYTARAVASLAFNETVGVVDGNVIRVLSRKYGLDKEWWKNDCRRLYQSLADELAQCEDPSALNQGLMELGATLCTPKKVLCPLCPWRKSCVALNTKTIDSLPRPKPRKKTEYWVFEPVILTRKKSGKISIGLTREHQLPVLKKDLFLPGPAHFVSEKPKNFITKHNITHHEFFVSKLKTHRSATKDLEWIPLDELSGKSPSAFLKKILKASLETEL